MPSNGKFYQKRAVGKRKIAILQIFSDFFCFHRTPHFACRVTIVLSEWAAGVHYPLYTCRFKKSRLSGHVTRTYRWGTSIFSPWAYPRFLEQFANSLSRIGATLESDSERGSEAQGRWGAGDVNRPPRCL